MFRSYFPVIFFVIAAGLVYAKDWVHYSGQGEVRDVAKTENGTFWAALAWGLQERSANGQIKSYTPGNDGLETADFVQIFALPNGSVIAASKTGVMVKKNRNSNRFETISSSFSEKKRSLLNGLGQVAGNILILPFEGALAFFDYENNRSVITLTQIGINSLEEYPVKRIAVKEDSVWIDLEVSVWKRKIDWSKISTDPYLADPSSWIEVNNKVIPVVETPKPEYAAVTNFPMERVKTMSLVSGKGAVAWDYFNFSRMQNDSWGHAFEADVSGYEGGNDQKNYFTKSLALLPSENFAAGIWGPGILAFNGNFPEAQMTGWFYAGNSGCPTEWSDRAWMGYTLVQGIVAAPDNSGYVFSYLSEARYGLGFLDGDAKNISCEKNANASAAIANSLIVRENSYGTLEIYVAWKYSLESASGGVDFYEASDLRNFKPELKNKWALSFGIPVDFAFDSKGVLWAVSSSKIFYLDSKDDEWKEPSYIRGFGGGQISALEADAQNGLWIGTLGDGAYAFSQINSSPDSLTAKHFKIKDGLMNETVYDIAIDTVKGKVYFANDFGLSVYSTNLVRSASDYMQDGAPKTTAYPNPFRPNVHNAVTIDYISEKSTVYILDSSGKRVRLFGGGDLRGGAVVWDGKNVNGKPVAPGLYYYIVANGSKTVKGKILVER